MPNWCENNISISGPLDKIKNLYDSICSKGLLTALVPRPEDEDNWYEWNIENWGTKWDIEAYIAPRDENDDTGQLNFDSAWSPPIDAFVEISSQFPELRIECRYFEEGCNFVGVCIIEDGAVVAEDEDSCDSDNLDRFEFAPMREEDWDEE